ncbi:MAG: Ribosome-recycling factor [bacterium ADurb.Bin270]|jgi:ribosome recycling factor|nr:ribosome recycling factor [Myxococcales bacterium]OQA58574.1 MAG: Ribosome-recycling factor [bacterium ADurb.Bin270]HQG13966.1 ribosome recycling factor [bacterium]
MDDKIFKETEAKMSRAMDALHHELARLRTGRASLSLVDEVRVEYYGTMTPLNQLSSLSIPDARTIAIQPWDASAGQAIEKAILKSGLGLNPISDGKIIRIPIPALNEERRRDLVKLVKKHAEDCKVAVRNVRRDSNEELKRLKKDSKITEDDERSGYDRIQKITDDFIKKVDETVTHKEKDIMSV